MYMINEELVKQAEKLLHGSWLNGKPHEIDEV